MNHKEGFTQDELKAELETIAGRNDAVHERISRQRERLGGVETDFRTLAGQIDAHQALLKREEQSLMRDVEALTGVRAAMADALLMRRTCQYQPAASSGVHTGYPAACMCVRLARMPQTKPLPRQ